MGLHPAGRRRWRRPHLHQLCVAWLRVKARCQTDTVGREKMEVVQVSAPSPVQPVIGDKQVYWAVTPQNPLRQLGKVVRASPVTVASATLSQQARCCEGWTVGGVSGTFSELVASNSKHFLLALLAAT